MKTVVMGETRCKAMHPKNNPGLRTLSMFLWNRIEMGWGGVVLSFIPAVLGWKLETCPR